MMQWWADYLDAQLAKGRRALAQAHFFEETARKARCGIRLLP
jgi:hypothetical protein